jgi:HEAT repeat protein
MKDSRTVDCLIVGLKNNNRDVRRRVAEMLGQVDSVAIPTLISSLKDKDRRVREGITIALGQIRDAQTLEPLFLALKDTDGNVRQAAVESLVQVGSDAVPFLIVMLNDKNSDVPRVADALGQIGDIQAVEPLVAALNHSDGAAREAAANALVKFGIPAVKPLLGMLRSENAEVINIAARTLAQIGTVSIDPLITALQDANIGVRWAAIWTLGEIRDTRALAPLLRALQDINTREAVAWALGKIKNAQAVPQLLATLHDENKEVRKATAWALGQIGDNRAVESLITTLKDADSDVGQAATQALLTIGVEPLMVGLRGKGLDTWKTVVEKIGQTGGGYAVQTLVNALPSQPQNVQQTMVKILTEMGYDLLPPKWPAYSTELSGYGSTISVKNPNDFAVRVGLRSGNLGKDFKVPPQKTISIGVPSGFSYSIYFQYSHDLLGVYQGDSFTLYDRNIIRISIVKVAGGNYNIRKVG